MELLWIAPENKKEWEVLHITSGTFICPKGCFLTFPQTPNYDFLTSLPLSPPTCPKFFSAHPACQYIGLTRTWTSKVSTGCIWEHLALGVQLSVLFVPLNSNIPLWIQQLRLPCIVRPISCIFRRTSGGLPCSKAKLLCLLWMFTWPDMLHWTVLEKYLWHVLRPNHSFPFLDLPFVESVEC